MKCKTRHLQFTLIQKHLDVSKARPDIYKFSTWQTSMKIAIWFITLSIRGRFLMHFSQNCLDVKCLVKHLYAFLVHYIGNILISKTVCSFSYVILLGQRCGKAKKNVLSFSTSSQRNCRTTEKPFQSILRVMLLLSI